MNISMWMVYDRLRAYNPVAEIRSNALCISGVRVMSMRENPMEDRTRLYVWLENASDPFAAHATIRLFNSGDFITLPDVEDTSRALNDLLETFTYYSAWENRLRDAVDRRQPQLLLDLATEALGNPMVMTDMNGDVLAMSSAYIDEDLNPFWIEIRQNRRLPLSATGRPMMNEQGTLTTWTDVPEIYTRPSGTRVIGAYFGNNREYVGGIGMWETKKDFLPSDPRLMALICKAALSIVALEDVEGTLHSPPSIVADILAGKEVDPLAVQMLQARYPGPSRLILLQNPYYDGTQIKSVQSYLLALIHRSGLRSVAMIYEGNVAALTHADDVERLLNHCVRNDGQQYFIACVSQTFTGLNDLYANYNMTRFLFTVADRQPGTYYAERYGLQYIVYDTRQNRYHRMIHPAIALLKAHDAEKGNGLYETLFHYLCNERSIQKTAQALHLHRNSLQYRLNQIRELTDLDLDDPMLRTYLIVSYCVDQDNARLQTETKA